jgi:hypothetical protein
VVDATGKVAIHPPNSQGELLVEVEADRRCFGIGLREDDEEIRSGVPGSVGQGIVRNDDPVVVLIVVVTPW